MSWITSNKISMKNICGMKYTNEEEATREEWEEEEEEEVE